MILYRVEQPEDDEAIEALYLRAFGAGRFAKTAERLREGNQEITALSFVAYAGEALVGAVRVWPVQDAAGQALLFLGPIAVEEAWRSHGIGGALVELCMAAAHQAGWGAVCLVGAHAFFADFGYRVIEPGTLAMPGPVDPARFLIAELVEGGADGLSGVLSVPPGATPRPAAPARERSPEALAEAAGCGTR